MAVRKHQAAPLIAALQAVKPSTSASGGKENEVPSPYPKGPKNGVGKEVEVPSPYPKGPKNDSPSPFPKGPKGPASKKKPTLPPSPGLRTPQGRRLPFIKGY
jgi:hypothetical protein